MKNNKFLVGLTIFFGLLTLILLSYPTKMFLKNYFLDFQKEVYLGGDNIVINFASNSENNATTYSKNLLTVGTMTYIDLDNNYAAIAHNLNSSANTGNIFIVPVYSVVKSTSKRVGEKDILLKFDSPKGNVTEVNNYGVYGNYSGSTKNKILMAFGMPREIKKEEALLYTNIDGSEVKAYKIEIIKINYFQENHNIYVKIIDEELINKTGGIIEGMSGSPIVQNGKIVGSLSHVDVNNPIYGYGVFITNMI